MSYINQEPTMQWVMVMVINGQNSLQKERFRCFPVQFFLRTTINYQSLTSMRIEIKEYSNDDNHNHYGNQKDQLRQI